VKACVKQKRQAQQELYLRFSYMMKGVCLRYSSNEQEAEDLLQDSFLKAFDKIKTFKNEGALGGWLRKLTLNTVLEYYRKNKQVNQTFELTEQSDLTDDGIIEQLELEDLLLKIQNLPTGFRTVFNLYAIEGYNHREIGKLLDISDGTSKSQYSRARKLLKNMITQKKEPQTQSYLN
jgi:RNA polymerase sigma-70 factor (ECF subfamily)